MNDQLARFCVIYRWPLALASLLLLLALGWGMKNLHFDSDYKIFFSDDNPQMLAHQANEATYAKSDNISFVLELKDGKVFSPSVLKAIIRLTELGWTMPYSGRVDSITNYQHTWVEGDDLVVRDLVTDPDSLTPAQLQELERIALSEPQLVNLIISDRGHSTMVSVNLNLPSERQAMSLATEEAVTFARDIARQIEADNPGIRLHLIGQTVVNHTFVEMSKRDTATLMPAMFVLILVLLQLTLRTFVGTLGTLIVIAVSVVAMQGFTGWIGYSLNQVNVASPIVVLTLAVCDCVHILNNYLYCLGSGQDKRRAMIESLRVNLQPVFLTSLTTAIGFLSMNASDSPPFQELGNIAAFGVMMAFWFSLTLFPALVMMLPMKGRKAATGPNPFVEATYKLVMTRPNQLFFSLLGVASILIVCMFQNELNDDTIEYFDTDVPFRQAADFTGENLTGFDIISYSLDSGRSNGVTDPAFLAKVEAFSQWYLAQPEVVQVSSFTNVMKRLNQNMHEDDPAWYRLPQDPELAAQYLLLYEMSLPFGLDLNNQINLDKSSTLVQVRVSNQKANELIALDERAAAWLAANAPDIASHGASISLMFAHIGQRNIDSMLTGSVLALILVTLTLIIALRSIRFGLISLLPNAFPAGMAFGLWAIFHGEVNLAVAVIFAITLGIVVDDTVHFISKYMRGRQEHGYAPPEAVHYAFTVVGKAIVTTTIALAGGFFVLAFSNFTVNAYMGLMVAITILIALIWDFLFLPVLLMKADK